MAETDTIQEETNITNRKERNVDSSNESGEFNSLVVMEFCPKVSEDTVKWLQQRVELPLSKGGAQLLVARVHCDNNAVRQ